MFSLLLSLIRAGRVNAWANAVGPASVSISILGDAAKAVDKTRREPHRDGVSWRAVSACSIAIVLGVAALRAIAPGIGARSELDPRKVLVSKGYSPNEAGLMSAMRSGDPNAVELFAKLNLRIRGSGPMAVLLFGPEPWDRGIAEALHRNMFADSAAACRPGWLLTRPVSEPAAERVAAFARLCDTMPVILSFERMSRREDMSAPASVARQKELDIWAKNLALLRGR